MKNLCAGIDFGTTNTTAAISGDGIVPRIIPLVGNNVIPTTMFFEKDTGRFFWGNVAVEKYINADEGRFMRSLKRVLGTDLMKVGTVINGKNMSYQTIIGEFIKNIKTEIDNTTGQNIERVVMGRPVHFRDGDPDGDARAESELKQIAMNAGFKEVLFQYEPIAAAFAHERHLKSEILAAVIDIGGGTSDFTIIRLGGTHAKKSDRANDILANTGVRIGGNDFDKQLSLNAFMPCLGMGTTYGTGDKILPVPSGHYFDLSEWSRVNSIYNYREINLVKTILMSSNASEKYRLLLNVIEKQLGHAVLNTVEETKIKLTEFDAVNASLEFIGALSDIVISREQFEKSIESDMKRVANSVHECIHLSGVGPNDIGLVILTGGSTEIPYARKVLCGIFPNASVSGGDKLSSVGLGLAYDAARRFS